MIFPIASKWPQAVFSRPWQREGPSRRNVSQENASMAKCGGRNTMSDNWIAGACMKKGALHRQLGIAPRKKIPAKTLSAAAKKGGVLGKRARLAQTLRKLGGRRG